MKVTAWRLVQAAYADSAFSGEGARRFPGRWNHRGAPMVYTAATRSLAALEVLVNVDAIAVLGRYVCIPARFDDGLCTTLAVSDLPDDWASDLAPVSTRNLGTAWVKSMRSPVLSVPSAVIPAERNYLLNPLHPEFNKIALGNAEVFRFDPRLNK